MSLHCRRKLSESIEINDEADVLIAFGTRIHGDLLRTLGEPTPPGTWFRVVKIENGVATINTKREDN